MRWPLTTTIFAFSEHVFCPVCLGFFLFCFCFLVTSLSLLATAMAFGSIWDKQSPAWERYKDNGGKGEVGIMGDRASFP